MDYNYHTHTYLCMHATGAMEHYIKHAIDGGIKYMGFSDHIPFLRADGDYSNYRIRPQTVDFYIEELSRLRKKYKEQIDIKIGFEMEYYPEDFERMLKSAIDYGAEYLILGEHFLEDECAQKPSVIAPNDSEEHLACYVQNVIDAIKSGVFTYVAHPDIINYTGPNKIYDREMMKLIKASEEYNVPLEINFLGIRENRNYPNMHFWELVGKTKAPVTFGFDAHYMNHAADLDSLPKAMEMVKKYNLNYIGKPNLINIQKI